MTAWDLGRVSEAASAADDAIFHVLATARANCHVKMTDAQLFGPDPTREDAEEDGQVALATEAAEPGEVAAPVDEPAPEEEWPEEDSLEAEPPVQRNGATDAAKPRRPSHAV